MAPESITQDRIYAAMKSDYRAGLFRPGIRIDLQGVADRHRASTTPVREAIHRLIGERLLTPHPDGGFQVSILDQRRLADLYSWFGQQVLGAMHMIRTPALSRALEPFQDRPPLVDRYRSADRAGQICLSIAMATHNGELVEQVEAANERLLYVRLAEYDVVPNAARELETLTRNGSSTGVSNMRRRLTAYHDRRIQHAPEIATALRNLL